MGGALSLPSLAGWGEILLYWLALSFILWTYALLAFLFATLGQSVSAGTAEAIGYFGIQKILLPSLQFALTPLLPGPLSKLVAQLPAAFLNDNSSALIAHLSSAPIALSNPPQSGAIPGAQAFLVLTCYALISIGLAWWVLRKRDVTQ